MVLLTFNYFILLFRKGYVLVNRGPLDVNSETGREEFGRTCFIGRVIHRVYPGGKILPRVVRYFMPFVAYVLCLTNINA